MTIQTKASKRRKYNRKETVASLVPKGPVKFWLDLRPQMPEDKIAQEVIQTYLIMMPPRRMLRTLGKLLLINANLRGVSTDQLVAQSLKQAKRRP